MANVEQIVGPGRGSRVSQLDLIESKVGVIAAAVQLSRSTAPGLPDDAQAFDTNRSYCAAVFGACDILSVASRFARLQELGHANNRNERLSARDGATVCIERYFI
jgi:hypothetical protein